MATRGTHAGAPFRHEALFYRGEKDFLDATVPFVSEGLARDEPVLAVLSQEKIELLRAGLGTRASSVQFADMADVGANPARIIPAWYAFLDEHAAEGRPLRGIGEPVWAGRSAEELVECQRHESLLNVAFGGVWPFWLLCPYDVGALAPEVLDEARRSHPYLERDGVHHDSPWYSADDMADDHAGDPLPEPPADALVVEFRAGDLSDLRATLRAAARRMGLPPERSSDLLVAVNELATNSLRHGGGSGSVRTWRSGRTVLAEVRDAGHLRDPLAGRRQPDTTLRGGRGLWLANQLCDLVQIRTRGEGLTVRVHMTAGPG